MGMSSKACHFGFLVNLLVGDEQRSKQCPNLRRDLGRSEKGQKREMLMSHGAADGAVLAPASPPTLPRNEETPLSPINGISTVDTVPQTFNRLEIKASRLSRKFFVRRVDFCFIFLSNSIGKWI